MKQPISQQSLDALANCALTKMQIARNDKVTVVEYSLSEFGAGGALGRLLAKRFNIDHNDRFASGLSEGLELGLAVAAAVQNNAFDLAATCDAIELALNNARKNWGDEYQEPRKAA